MKHLYVLLAALSLSMAASAANKLTFYIDGKAIENGSTVEFTKVTIEEDYEDGFGAIKMEPVLSLTTDFYSGKIAVTAACTTGESIMMCCGGQCATGESVTKNVSLNPGNVLPLQFHYENYEVALDAIPTVVTEFTATDGSGKNEAASFTLVMKQAPAGVGGIEAGDSVKLTSAGITYSLSASAELSVYSIVGRRVLGRTVSGAGTVSLDGLAKGCYIYTLAGRTGKIYVK